ncbi:phosphate acyltransferase PlsX [[Mycoplasma] mobile]|uniref:Phosphate acyltransferase n=1 Tax=Mycoplasma mobile (strain ATCC 43663 / 163K / NCTC 11711) TaxID=267748 RepID=PLSX_MYCM1|nr:phosphate acyltransferase PlsX [[Mycoplasma] mobile]Q6KHN2.1 RecName: Full=Phosphate acyltransferase; AltName: Full=Acyl-ACP phosphotransacylase; AltName: Full=Acyl-[acyl-carrier-protein]--phosphate acyltransferase; AltName: Full=Phosphate-acyl-ACP acyltransferase [Mycoplasma mobile 163K]AAT27898.1 fatty acid/phospholipid synthesis protein [Mycoplasma mobile 163K]
MKIIAFDVMGSDKGVGPAVLASINFVKKNLDYKIILVGDKTLITKYVSENERIEIYDEPLEVKKGENLKAVLSKTTSMSVAIDLVKDNKAEVVLSAGDSASYLALCVIKLKRLEGITRPAFMPIFPTILDDKKFVLLDVGANIEVDTEYLVQWAKLGSVFAKIMWNIDKPNVGILNIGTEDFKGFKYHQEANQILKEANLSEMNYKGFVEPRDILKGNFDVIVADGYGGNLVLKSLEGTVIDFSSLIKRKITSTFFRKIGALILKKSFKEIKEHLDYRNVGGAWVIGVNSIAVKAHGSSDEKAFKGAFNQIKIAVENNVIENFKEIL